jgi:hypothetical protein
MSNYKWRVLFGLSVVWLIFTIVWAMQFVAVPPGSTRGYETTKFVFLSVSAFGVLFSALLSSFNALEATLNVRDRMDFDRVENSFRIIERWEQPTLKEARDYTRKLKAEEHSTSPSELIRRIEGPVEPGHETERLKLQRSVIGLFNYFEEIELSIQKNRVDSHLLRQAFKDPYESVYRRFRAYIDTHFDREQRDLLAALNRRWS